MKLFDLIDEKLTDGFAGINKRLDTLNGQVHRHGEDIAVLKRESARIEVLDIEIRKAVLQQNLCAYNCPWKSGDPTAMPVSRKDARVQATKVGVAAAAGTGLLFEVVPMIVDWIRMGLR
jgi:hypothetical protein